MSNGSWADALNSVELTESSELHLGSCASPRTFKARQNSMHDSSVDKQQISEVLSTWTRWNVIKSIIFKSLLCDYWFVVEHKALICRSESSLFYFRLILIHTLYILYVGNNTHFFFFPLLSLNSQANINVVTTSSASITANKRYPHIRRKVLRTIWGSWLRAIWGFLAVLSTGYPKSGNIFYMTLIWPSSTSSTGTH